MPIMTGSRTFIFHLFNVLDNKYQLKISGHRGMVVIPLQNYKNYKEMIPILDLYFSGKRM
jgi:hypothetical protein